jgi:hypothetical protein
MNDIGQHGEDKTRTVSLIKLTEYTPGQAMVHNAQPLSFRVQEKLLAYGPYSEHRVTVNHFANLVKMYSHQRYKIPSIIVELEIFLITPDGIGPVAFCVYKVAIHVPLSNEEYLITDDIVDHIVKDIIVQRTAALLSGGTP